MARYMQAAVKRVQALERHSPGARRQAQEARVGGSAHRLAPSTARRLREEEPRGLKDERKIREYKRKIHQLKDFLRSPEKKVGPTGNERGMSL